jgi:demethylmenaquinone methyltransferase/2-methoxy-6-polyprenyl-1,4-benzoquinol methylase
MFDAIAPRYDLLNRIISLGVDQRWRRRTVDALALSGETHTLDLATGTADLAILTVRRCKGARVTGLDPSAGMLAVGARKLARLGLQTRVTLTEGDAQALPFAPQTFDGATMAFGIRNVPDRARALAELHRVLRPGARAAILELSDPRGGALSRLTRFHIHTVVPWVGALLSGARAYRYLHESIAAFPPPEAFAQLLRAAGFREVSATPLTFGVCCLYVGTR